MSFRLVPKSMTLNDLERRNGRIHCVISLNLVNLCSIRVDLCMAEFMHESVVFCSACTMSS